jgi:uncharacterized protein YjbI with pentapeptide repeats
MKTAITKATAWAARVRSGLFELWRTHRALVTVAACVPGAVVIAWLLVSPVTNFIAHEDVGKSSHVPAATREAVRTQMLTLGAGLFAAGALVFTAANYYLSRRRLLSEQFSAIASQIGDDQAAVRLAGLQAMARLADDWQANRQGCIDVLCAYLRMNRGRGLQQGGAAAAEGPAGASRQARGTGVPIIDGLVRMFWPDTAIEETAAAKDRADREEAQVRATVIQLIAEHLKSPLWRGKYFDFTGAVFEVRGRDFTEVVFEKNRYLRFDYAEFGEEFSFDKATFATDNALFSNAEFSGTTVGFKHARFKCGEVQFNNAKFSGNTANFDGAKFQGANVNFHDVEFSHGTVSFNYAEFSRGKVGFDRATFSGDMASFEHARFSGGTASLDGAELENGVWFTYANFFGRLVSFKDAEFLEGGNVSFYGARFSGRQRHNGDPEYVGDTAAFDRAKFQGANVKFDGAKFERGKVWFTGAEFSSGTVSFKDAEFSGATVDFRGAKFSGATVDFRGAKFNGGTVDLRDASEWTVPPKFPDKRPPELLLPH